MSNTSAESAGGSAGASGVGFQNQVFAWAASCLVAEIPLQIPLIAGKVVAVGAQTGFEVDDVAVLTDAGNAMFVQAKVGMALGAVDGSPLAKALKQAVRLYLQGTVPLIGTGGRPVDSVRDAIILCTDHSAPATVRENLRTALRRTATQPPGTVLGKELTGPQNAGLGIALGHIRPAWRDASAGVEPTDEELRKFFKALQVLVLDLGEGRTDQQVALNVLQRGLADPTTATHAWKILVDEGQAASVEREWRDRESLTLAFAQQDIATNYPVKHSTDIDVLRERSTANLSILAKEARLPVADGVYIHRSVAKVLRETLGREPILVVGDAGTGKSAVIQDLASTRQTKEDVVVLRASDVAGTNRLETKSPLPAVMRAWVGPPGLLIVDGVDALRGSEDREYLSSIVAELANTRWQVVASARTFDTRNSEPLQSAFAGVPVTTDTSMVDPQLCSVRHLLVGDLTDEDLESEIVAPMLLADVLAGSAPDLRNLLRNPFNLRLAAGLANKMTPGERAELLSVRSRVELLHYYWRKRVGGAGESAREALLKRLAADMVEGRRLQSVAQEPTVRETDTVALESLLSHSVLNRLDGPIPGVGRVLAFSHNILFDYATAIYVLYDPVDPAQLARRLDADPTLPLIARPSFDLLVDLLWQARESGGFWPTVLSVAGSEHVLASLAVASRVVHLARNSNELLELADGTAGDQGCIDKARQRFVHQIVGAVRAPAVVPDATTVMLPLANLAKHLTKNAEACFEAAALATDLLSALYYRAPISAEEPEAVGTVERAEAMEALLDAARSDPIRRELMAESLMRQAASVVAVSPDLRGAIKRLLDDDAALTQWGGTVLHWFAESVAPVITQDRDLARRLAAISITFEETRDEDVALGGSAVVPLRESRKQQAQHAAWVLGEEFPKICDADCVIAAEIICDALGAVDSEDDASWPVVTNSARGWLKDGFAFGRSLDGNENVQKMLSALANELVNQSDVVSQHVVSLLVERIHNADVWAGLMENQENPASLCRALFPAFESGTLLVHPDTSPQAATLIKAAVAEGTVAHRELEAIVATALCLVDHRGRGDYLKGVLLGCLNSEAITDEAIAAQREAMGDEIPEIPTARSMFGDYLPPPSGDYFNEGGVVLEPEASAAAHNLRKALEESNETDAPSPAIAKLAKQFVLAYDLSGAYDPAPRRLQYLLVDAAAKLARATEITPDHSCGHLITKVLIEAAGSDDAGSFAT